MSDILCSIMKWNAKYVFVCVCVCVCRKREKEREERETDSRKERKWERNCDLERIRDLEILCTV